MSLCEFRPPFHTAAMTREPIWKVRAGDANNRDGNCARRRRDSWRSAEAIRAGGPQMVATTVAKMGAGIAMAFLSVCACRAAATPDRRQYFLCELRCLAGRRCGAGTPTRQKLAGGGLAVSILKTTKADVRRHDSDRPVLLRFLLRRLSSEWCSQWRFR